MFKTVQTLKTIDFYELELWKLKRLVSLCNDIYEVNLSMKPSVFISYASEQDEIAHAVWANLQERGIQTWIYKESVPAGSNYLDELPKAIDSIEVMVLLLSEEAQESPWVQREVGCAVDENKVILPFQLSEFPLNVEMKFLLKNSQIKSLWKEDGKNKIPVMVREVVKRLDIT